MFNLLLENPCSINVSAHVSGSFLHFCYSAEPLEVIGELKKNIPGTFKKFPHLSLETAKAGEGVMRRV